jgi:pyrroline-5-carboxylate reductase
MKKLGIIGAGKMATAITRGLLEKQVYRPQELIAADINESILRQYITSTQVDCTSDNHFLIAQAETIILAVKPQHAQEVLQPIQTGLADKLLISIAAGISLTKLENWTGTARVIRVMPNTPVTVGLGASVYAVAAGVSPGDKQLVETIFGAVGICKEMKETAIDAVTGLSGSGPAYVFEFIQALVDGAVNVGLPADDALELIIQTVSGSAEMLRQKLGTPDELRIAVTSPGGTTAAGLTVLNEAGFRHLIGQVVKKATARSRELGK